MFEMMAEQLPAAVYLMHILCAGLALSAAFLANMFGLTILLLDRPIRAGFWVQPLHIVITVCLIGLWVTGLTLVAAKFTLATVPVPVVFKLLLATVLCVNGLMIGQNVARTAAIWPRPAIFHLTLRRLCGIITCTSLSLTCWISAFAMALHDGVRAAATYQVVTWFALLWLLLAAAVVLLIGVRVLLETILGDRFASESSVKQAFAEPRFIPVQTPASTASHKTNGPAAAPMRKPVVSMARTIKSCVWALSGIFCISFVTNLLMLTGPLFMLQIYDRVLTSRSIPTLTALLALVAGLFLFLGIMELLRSRVLVRVGQRVERQINDTIFQSVVSVSPSTIKPRKQRLLQDLESVRQFFSTSAPAAMFDLPWTPLYFAVIFMFHWVLGLVAIAGAAVLFLISLCNEFASRKPVARAGEFATRSTALAEAGRRNAEVLHAMGMFEAFRQRWLDIHRAGISHHLSAADVSGTMSVISKVTRLFLQSLMLAAGAYYAVAGEISAGVIVAASIILSRALAPIEQIVGQWRNIIVVRQGYGRLSKALTDQVHHDTRITLPEPKGFLSAERLYAGALGSREPVLKDLNFYIRPGDAVAVVGSNASGK